MRWSMKMLKYLIAWDLAAGIIVSLFLGVQMSFFVGLIIGALTICLNFRLLKCVIDNITQTGSIIRTILAMFLYVFRLLIFLGTIYACVKISFYCAAGYSVSVIGFSLVIVITNLRGDIK